MVYKIKLTYEKVLDILDQKLIPSKRIRYSPHPAYTKLVIQTKP